MATTHGAILLRHIRKLASAPDADRQLDGQLLQRYIGYGDEAAFAALVERHGPMVRSVCRSVLRHEQEAEDVFQATFLVLARTAPSIRKPQAVSSWLHGVAYRLALKVKRRTERQRRHEQQVPPPASAGAMDDVTWRELRAILHEELHRLAEKYRLPLLLCYWEGKTRDEAAAQLGWTCGTLKERLQRGRNLLRGRLTRRGLVPSAALFAAFLAERAAAALSAALVQQTARAALCFAAGKTASAGLPTAAVASLAQEALPAARLTWWALTLLILVGLGASGIVIYHGLRAGAPDTVEAAQPEAGPTDTKPESAVLAAGLPLKAGPAPAQPRPDFPTDPLPAGAVAQFGSPRFQDGDMNRCASFSPDGKWLATAGNNGPITIWDAATGKRVETHQNRGSVFDLRWKADGKLAALVAFGHDNFLMQEFVAGQKPDPKEDERLDEEARELARRPPAEVQERGRLYGCSLSPDGQSVVAIRNRADKPVQWTEVCRFTPGQTSQTVKPVARIDKATGYAAWLSGDGKVLLSQVAATMNQPAQLLAFDLAAKDKDKPAWALPLPGGNDRKPVACFSPHGKEVVMHFVEGSVELWDGPLGKRIRAFPKVAMFYHHNNGEWGGVDLTADGKRLALLHRGADGAVGGRIVDVQTGKDLCTLVPLPMPRINFGICFSADGSRVARVAFGVVRIWNADTGADACPLPGHRGAVTSIAVVGNGKTVVTTGEDFTVRAWDPKSGDELWRTVLPDFTTIKFATADAVVVAQDENWGLDSPKPGLRIELATGQSKPLPGQLGKAKRTLPLAVSPDGKKVVTLAFDAKKPAFEVWSWPAGERLAQVPLEPPGKFGLRYCAAAYFTPDGQQLVALLYYDDPAEQEAMRRVPAHPFIERWDLAAGKLLDRSKPGKGNEPQLLPCGKGLWSWTAENEIRDAITGALLVKLQFPEDEAIDVYRSRAAALSADGKSLAIAENVPGRSSGNRIVVFDLGTGKLARTFPANSSIHALHYLPDGRLVSLGDTAILWSVTAGKP